MYEKILVPLDGSEVAEAVLPNVEDLAVKMAPAISIEITLIQVVSLLTYNVLTEDEKYQVPYSDNEMGQIKQKVQAYLDKVAAGLKSKGINVKTMVRAGHAAEEIIDAAHEMNANLIAMSTHGLSGIKRWALGSIADHFD